MATVLVGPEETKFVIHQALLCDKSKYFAKALTGSFEEGTTGIVRLEDVSPVLFKIVVSWLYWGKIAYSVSDDDLSIDQGFKKLKREDDKFSENLNADDTSTWPIHILVRLYILADRLDIKDLRNDIIDALVTSAEKSGIGLRVYSYKLIDSDTTAESPLRKFAVDRLAYGARHNMEHRGFWRDIPQDMAVTALLLSCRRVPHTLCNSCYQKGLAHNGIKLAADHPCKNEDKKPLMVNACVYHEHADDEETKLCQVSRDKTVKK
ncbi:hypothetical protein M436DRAFT_69568 [Aureobasidium namibiae CBS 147.97]|uniref:BTB domain-containing protein n=1 Tax=Aureobasidium namibiae CBS 147.97 TaxID=1043004 RepID=A0A074WYN6_9PEZI|nr:uncharacterized protein M436DRAFT_69568 [Aureobasidium namibiae CBS 147.97]KEQ76599.1 hypothetical protein M436DRAFT_69568 [Aureobasidium namibiae CBS 147.97]